MLTKVKHKSQKEASISEQKKYSKICGTLMFENPKPEIEIPLRKMNEWDVVVSASQKLHKGGLISSKKKKLIGSAKAHMIMGEKKVDIPLDVYKVIAEDDVKK